MIDAEPFLSDNCSELDFNDILDLLDFDLPTPCAGKMACINTGRNDITIIVKTCTGTESTIIGPELVASTTKTRKKMPERRAFKKGMSVKQALLAYDKKPNMSRRAPTNVLVAFPVFDKCDSLLYFPSTMVKYFNSVNMDSASKLLNKYIDKNCVISFNTNVYKSLSPSIYMQMMVTAAELEPDRIMCVHSTKVVENQIRSTIYIKATDLQPLHGHLSSTFAVFNEADSAKLGLHPDRKKRFQLYGGSSTNEQVQQDLQSHATSEEDVEMYTRLDYTMTIDQHKRKITRIDHIYTLTSMYVAGNKPPQLL